LLGPDSPVTHAKLYELTWQGFLKTQNKGETRLNTTNDFSLLIFFFFFFGNNSQIWEFENNNNGIIRR
jgi:hypothetical protein